ncbi:FUSC family protein [Agrilutibacter solisilvae]|uniref:FUSC family protein n=1 Tax=Agrilutibacter solisilvae TaxID=2763317 RepID=A0A975ASF1_9GAMM|nr:FUSC family protein [Lysobacter solisilvae]QSX78682.1 FUSC family protein [Lysobacter solisilvae]
MASSVLPHLQLPLRAALAAALAVALAQWLRLEHPMYALVGAVIVTDLVPAQTRQLGVWRMVGTVLGATLGALLSYFPHGPVAIGIGIAAAMFLCHVLKLRGAAKVSGYVCGIILLEHAVEPWTYAYFRLLETALGIAMAILVSLVPLMRPPDDGK